MSHYYQTYAITLHRRDIRENDRYLSFYTQDLGKVQAIVSGAKKIKSRLSGHLEPFALVELGIVRGAKINKVTSAQCVFRYSRLMENIDKMMCAGFCLRFLNKMVHVGVSDKKIFTLLTSALEAMNTEESDYNVKIFNAVFTLKAMSLLGYAPELAKCVVCKSEEINELIVFSFNKGGIVCSRCREGVAGENISLKELQCLQKSLQIDFHEAMHLKEDEALYKKYNTLVSKFFMYHLPVSV